MYDTRLQLKTNVHLSQQSTLATRTRYAVISATTINEINGKHFNTVTILFEQMNRTQIFNVLEYYFSKNKEST